MPPVNDDRADAIEITLSTTFTANNAGATVEPDEPTATSWVGSTIWYYFTLTEPTQIELKLTRSFPVIYTIWDPGFTRSFVGSFATGTGTAIFFRETLAAGTYYLQLGSWGSNQTTGDIGVELSVLASGLPVVPNDEIAGAIPITSSSFSTTQNMLGASISVDEPALISTVDTVWYSITLTQDTLIALSTEGSSFNTRMAVYRSDLSWIKSNYNALSGGTHSWLSFTARANQTYLVMVGRLVNSERGEPYSLSFEVVEAQETEIDWDRWTLVPMRNWDYQPCDTSLDPIFESGWSWYGTYYNASSYVADEAEYIEVYWEAITHRDLGDVILVWYFADTDWNDIVCPLDPVFQIGPDPSYPQGVHGGAWSEWQDPYVVDVVKSVITTSSRSGRRSVTANANLEGSTYEPGPDLESWTKAVTGVGASTFSNFPSTSTNFFVGWQAGADRGGAIGQGDRFRITHHIQNNLRIGNETPSWYQETWPNDILDAESQLEWGEDGDFYEVPGSWWLGGEYLQHDVGAPQVVRAGVYVERFGARANLNENNTDTLSFPFTMDVGFELDPEFSSSLSGGTIERDIIPRDASKRTTVRVNVSAPTQTPALVTLSEVINGSLVEILDGGGHDGTEWETWVIEVPSVTAALQEAANQGITAYPPVVVVTDPHYQETLTPPPWGGAGASFFGGRVHNVGLYANDLRLGFWFEVQFPRWRYWNPTGVEAPPPPLPEFIRIPHLRLVQRDDHYP